MTYEEYLRHLQELNKTHAGQQLTEQQIDEEIALVNHLTCTGGGVPKPLFGPGREPNVLVFVHALDRGEKFPGHPCPHCTGLAVLKWAKSAHEAKRKGMPEPPPTVSLSVLSQGKEGPLCGGYRWSRPLLLQKFPQVISSVFDANCRG